VSALPPGVSGGDAELEARLSEGLGRVEAVLSGVLDSTDPIASAVTHHLAEAGGKRLRPLLTLLTAGLGDAGRPEIVDAAAVVELTHLASLYHDDVMDAAPLRRGAPSAHEVFGASAAILAGDLLFAKASLLVAGLGPEAVRVQARTFERLCLGQLHETVGPAPGEDPVRHHLSVLSDKTGALIATAARFGAWLAGCPPETVDAVVAYGEKAGVAFQLADDVIDLTADPTHTGKTPGTDLRDGVATMPQLLVEAEARRDAAAGRGETAAMALARDMGGDLAQDAALDSVVARLTAHPATARTRELARSWAAEAVAQLAPLPDGPVKVALEAFATLAARRLA
jgi:heptaprenyl diphosphate synthase